MRGHEKVWPVSKGQFYEGRRFLFLTQRMHTNQVGWVRALQGAGARVHVFAWYSEASEDHSTIRPQRIFPTVVSLVRVVSHRLMEPQKPRGNSIRSYFRPSQLHIVMIVLLLSPDYVFYRGHRFGRLLNFVLRRKKVGLIRLTQRPIQTSPGEEDDRFRRPPRIEISPIVAGSLRDACVRPGLCPTLTDSVKRKFWVPFVVPDLLRHPPVKPTSRIKILCVAKYRSYKNHDLLISALRRIETTFLDEFELTIVGTAYSPQEFTYRNKIEAELSRIKRLSFKTLTNVPHSEMSGVYSSHQILVLSSNRDVAAIAPLEAMANGCVPVTSMGSGTRCYYDWVFPPFEPASSRDLASSLERLICDTEFLQKARGEALMTAENLLSSEVFLYTLAGALVHLGPSGKHT